VVAAGAAIANLQIAYDGDGLRITTGWMTTPPASAAAGPTSGASVPVTAAGVSLPAALAGQSDGSEEWRVALRALEEALRREITDVRRTAAAGARASAAGAADAVLVARIEAMIAESERRQRHELGLRIAQVGVDVDARRRAEIVRLQQDVWRTNATQQDLINLFRRVSTQTP
jgi:hypothetical protein